MSAIKAKELDGMRVAILASDGFELSELTEPKRALEEAGAEVDVLAPAKAAQSRQGSDCPDNEIQGVKHHTKAGRVRIDGLIADADPEEYDAVHLPGGVINSDALRIDEDAQEFVQAFANDKPLGVICHGAWLLVSAGLVKGRKLTSWATLEDDIRNAGGDWEYREVIRDKNWVSSRMPADLPAFNRTFVEVIRERASRREAAA
jgi:protease I